MAKAIIDEVETLNIFIVYSRSDIDFSDQLRIALIDAGFRARLDRHEILGAEDWRRRLAELISDADVVVFVLSPSSCNSTECAWEVDEAVKLSKRIIPVVCIPLQGTAPPIFLAKLNYIYFYSEPKLPGSGFGSGLAALKGLLNEDPSWLRQHTYLLKRARTWIEGGGVPGALLSEQDAITSQNWLRNQPKSVPEPSDLHKNFIAESVRSRTVEVTARNLKYAQRAAIFSAALLSLIVAGGFWYVENLKRTAAIDNDVQKNSYQAELSNLRLATISETEKLKRDHKTELDKLRDAARRELRNFAAENLRRIVKNRNEQRQLVSECSENANAEPAPNPVTRISKSTTELILLHEVGGEEVYRRRSRVQRPLNNSGVTIGIGFDLKYVKEAQLRSVWRELPTGQLDRLAPLASKFGKEAELLYSSVQDIEVPFVIAKKVYLENTLVEFTKKLERIYPQAVALPNDSYGALLSLILNRGSDLSERSSDGSGDSRDEMRAIGKLLEIRELNAIPEQIRSMKWLWWMSERNDVKGLLARREAEANLFEEGLRTIIKDDSASERVCP